MDDEFPSSTKFLGLINLGCTLETGKQKKECHPLTQLLKSKKYKLETLSLSQNQIGVKGAFFISQGLCFNKTLKILELACNKLGAKGCYLLCEAIKESDTVLQSLDLSYNDIKCTGAHSVALMVNNSKIEELRIQGNGIACQGFISLFSNLTYSRLKILDVSQNIVQIGMLHTFRNFLKGTKELIAFCISGLHYFNQRAFDSICQSLQENKSITTLEFGNLTRTHFVMLQKVQAKKYDFILIEPEKFCKERIQN